MSEQNSPDPIAEGKLAATSGGVTASNPYPQGTQEHAQWLDGYQDALDTEDDGLPSDFA